MAGTYRQGSNLMATLCRDAERCSRRSLQINQQCELCVNQMLIRRLRREQRLIENRLRQWQMLIKGIDRDATLDPMSLDFVSEVVRRAMARIQSSVN